MTKIKEILYQVQLKDLPKGVLDEIANPNTVDIFTEPEFETSRTQLFKFGNEGIDLPTGKQILVIVPNGGNIRLQDVFLGHRKREKYSGLKPGQFFSGYDENGAYTEVLVFDGNTNQWKSWKDPKGYDPIKFAEPRDTIEFEKLSDYFGMLGEIRPVAFLLISRGKGDPQKSVVTEHTLEVMSYPDMHTGVEEVKRIFSPGTDFVDFKNPKGPNRLPKYGGGKSHHIKGPNQVSGDPGGYPGAVPLRNKVGVEPFKMTEKLKNDIEELDADGRLWVNIPTGKKILLVEISAGARYWGAKLPDKKLACIGGRKISVYIVNKTGKKIDHFMRSMNVGPQGVLIGGPTDSNYITQPGDRIMIEGEKHTSYVMGYRVLYENAKSPQATLSEQVKSKTHIVINAERHAPQPKPKYGPKLDLKKTNDFAGSHSARWEIDINSGDRFMVKPYSDSLNEKIRYDRCATEYIANKIYRLMGIPVPESYLYKNNVVSREIKGLTGFNSSGKNDQYKVKSFFQHPDIKNGFIVDAWLANWNVFGLNFEKVSKTHDNRMQRLDAGGTMFFRGTGEHKAAFGNENVSEIENMRNPLKAQQAGVVFQGFVSNADITNQVIKLSKLMTDDLIKEIVNETKISNAQEIINILIARRNWLIKYYGISIQVKPHVAVSKEGHTADAEQPKSKPHLIINVSKQGHVTGHTSTSHKPGSVVNPVTTPKSEYGHGLKLNLKPTNDHCGGTQGAKWFIDTNTGDKFVVKTYSNSPNETVRYDRCATEYISNKIYRLMGIPAPESYMHDGNVVSREIKGIKGFPAGNKYDKNKVKTFFEHHDVKAGFIVDAWLANWDVFGLKYDNVFKSPDGKMYRVDAGGTLFFRGLGQHKPSFGNEKVDEIETMRNPAKANEAGIIFQGFVKTADIKLQAAKLAKVMTDTVIKEIVSETKISNAKEIINTLIARRNWIVKNFG